MSFRSMGTTIACAKAHAFRNGHDIASFRPALNRFLNKMVSDFKALAIAHGGQLVRIPLLPNMLLSALLPSLPELLNPDADLSATMLLMGFAKSRNLVLPLIMFAAAARRSDAAAILTSSIEFGTATEEVPDWVAIAIPNVKVTNSALKKRNGKNITAFLPHEANRLCWLSRTTNCRNGGPVTWYRTHHSLCPVRILHCFNVAFPFSRRPFLFAARAATSSMSLTSIGPSSIDRWFATHDWPQGILTHSARIGATSLALKAEVPTSVILTLGRWSSQSTMVKVYARNVPRAGPTWNPNLGTTPEPDNLSNNLLACLGL